MDHAKGLSTILTSIIFALVGFMVLRVILIPTELIILLNGMFAGAVSAVAVAYGPLLWNTFAGRQPYDRVWQMTLGFVVLWAAVCINASGSVIALMEGGIINADDPILIGRFLSIVAACIQVSAPDFGLGIFHGRDRKVLWSAISLGLVVAISLVYLQAGNAR